MEEQFKKIPGNDGYLISNYGRIVHLKPIRPRKAATGFWGVQLANHQRYLLHRLVAEAFVPNPDGKQCVLHKDGDLSNNSADNLEWGTQAQNHKGVVKMPVLCVELGQSFESISKAAKVLNINEKSIAGAVKSELQVTAGGYHWILTEALNLLIDKEE